MRWPADPPPGLCLSAPSPILGTATSSHAECCESVLLVVWIVCPEPDQAAETLDDRTDDSKPSQLAGSFTLWGAGRGGSTAKPEHSLNRHARHSRPAVRGPPTE